MDRATGLAEEQRHALERLGLQPGMSGFYLAGGTALGIRLGHRTSIDLYGRRSGMFASSREAKCPCT